MAAEPKLLSLPGLVMAGRTSCRYMLRIRGLMLMSAAQGASTCSNKLHFSVKPLHTARLACFVQSIKEATFKVCDLTVDASMRFQQPSRRKTVLSLYPLRIS